MPDRASDPSQAWEEWRAERHRSVTAPTGNLALVETRWLPAGERPDLAAARAGQRDSVTVTTVQRTDIATGEPEYALRVWDAESPAIRHFERIDAFPFDPDWVVEATFTPVAGRPPRRLRAHPRQRRHPRPRRARRHPLTVDGIDYTLERVRRRRHAAARLRRRDQRRRTPTAPDGSSRRQRARASERVVLDFNRAFVPPCGFSAQYNCPLPPRQNRFRRARPAGEKLPVFRDGFAGQH